MGQQILITPDQVNAWQEVPQAQAQSAAPNESGGVVEQLMQMLGDYGVGAMKGVRSTATNVAPGLQQLQNDYGGGDMLASMKLNEPPTNTAQKAGKVTEQIGEYFPAAGGLRKLGVEATARMIPNSASPASMKILNQLAAILGRTGGEAANAGLTAHAHGDPDVGTEMATAAAGPLIAGPVGAMFDNDAFRNFMSMMLAGIPAKAGSGFAQRMGTFGYMRKLLYDALPNANAVAKRVPLATRAAAGITEQSEPKR